MKNKIFLLLFFILGMSVSMSAADWSVNPYDFQYDMTAYVNLKIDGGETANLNNYEIAAFSGDECRGILDVRSVAGNQYGYIRIRSNSASGETISFKVRNKNSGKDLKCNTTLSFASDSSVGLPSKPFTIEAANQYKIEFVVDGKTETTYQYYGDKLEVPANPIKEGHEFTGWSPDLVETVPAHDLSFTATFRVLSYIATFRLDGTVYEQRSIEYGATVTTPDAPEKEGHTFAGWQNVPETMPAHDIEILGSYTVNQYKLTYVVDGTTYREYTLDYGTAITPETAPTKEGYTFSGWDNVPETMPAQDVTVTGSFAINSYNAVFKIGDEVIETRTFEFGASVTTPEAPEKEGHTFAGWQNVPETMPAHDIEILGSYTVNQYKLTYVVDGTTYREYTLDYGTAITPETAPTKEGYTFSGWDNVPETMPAHDVTVSGRFGVNFYNAVFKIGNEVIETKVFEFGASVTTPEAPEKEGHTFAGWLNVPETMPAHDIEILGSYTVNQYKLTYVVDGTTYKEYTLDYGTAITPETAPTKEGYTFSGWDNVPETMPAQDVTVTGSFSINSYNAVFKIGDEVIETRTFEFGATVTTPEAPEKEGHTFTGWQNVPETMPAHDIEIMGGYTVNQYKLTYVVDGATYKEYTLDYGTAITPETAPTKEGYTFSGWDNVPETMPAHDVTVSGRFGVNFYNAVFKIGDEVIETRTFEFGAVVTTPEAPEKEGHTFAGWQNVPQTMPAHDIEILGSYTVNQYKLTYVVDGTTYKEYTLDYGTAITPETAPTKEGYTFFGWDNVPETMPAHDVTVSGRFGVNFYNAVFKIGDEVIETRTFEFGAVVTTPEAPEKEGHTFAGWQNVPETMPAHDIEIPGSYTVNQYKLTYVVDGATYKEYTLDYGTAITPETAPTKEGYTFSGWDNVPETMPAQDVTVTGSFAINSYNAVYKIGDEVIETKVFEFGAVVTTPEAPEKEGHTFAGWQNVPETMPAHDIEILGSYVSNVEITFSKKQIHLTNKDIENASIRYTTDGSEPTNSHGILYDNPFLPANDCTIKAVAYKEGFITTNPSSYDYVAEEHTVPRLYIQPMYRDRILVLIPDTQETTLATGDSIVMENNTILRGGDEIRAIDFPTEMFGNLAVFEWKSEELLERGPVVMPIEYASTPQFNYDGVTLSIANERGNLVLTEIRYDDNTTLSDESTLEGIFSFNPYTTGGVVCHAYDEGLFRSEPGVFQIHAVRLDEENSVILNESGWLNQAITNEEAFDWETLSVEGPAQTFAPINSEDLNLMARMDNLSHLDLSATSPDANSTADFSNLNKLMSISLPETEVGNCNWNLDKAELLSAIKWNSDSSMPDEMFASLRNRHALLYVKNEALAPQSVINVVSNGVAEKLTLSHDYPFCVIDEFEAQTAVFTKNFNKKTEIDHSFGWETLVVPFDVDMVMQTGEMNREIKPFLQIEPDDETTPGFWLASTDSLGNSGKWNDCRNILAGMPYAIAMPNSIEYIEEFNITGDIDFIGHDVMVTDNLAALDFSDVNGQERHFAGSYVAMESADNVFALVEEPEGSVFAPSSKSVRPFECWFDGTPGMSKIAIGGGSNAVNQLRATDTGIKIWQEGDNLMILATSDMQTGITDLTGSLIRRVSLRGGETTTINGLTPGIYIIAKRKFMVK